MARRKDPIEKWLEQAVGTDETRPFLLKPAISADDENIRVCSDGHRLHLTNAKLYSKEITNEWKSPTDMLFKPNPVYKIIKKFRRDQLITEIETMLHENLDRRVIERIKELNESADLFAGIKSEYNRETLETSIKETLATLREYRNPKTAISLEKWLGVNVHVNPLYLFEALNYPSQNIWISNDNDELGPIIIEYLDIPLAACIMPMRH